MSYQLWPAWSEIILPSLRCQMTGATFDQILSNSELYKNGDETLIIKARSEIAAKWLEGRLSEVVKRSLILSGGLPNTITIKFTYEGGGLLDTPAGDDEGGGLLDTPAGDDQPGDDQPIWDTKAQVLWCLNHKEASGQYFRYYWRPLLGPLLSEIVRELRQLGFRKDSRAANVEVKTTHLYLAKMIGVDRSTISIALQREDELGPFYRNKYLHLFITQSYTVTAFHEKSKRHVNDHTNFLIAMNDPILPEHEIFF